MGHRLEVADLSLATLDALDVDAVALLVGPERPLTGLAGLVDWRLAGAVTRALRGGLYAAGADEGLLLPTGGRLPARRVICLGAPDLQQAEAWAEAARRLLEVLGRAGSTAFATALPPPPGGDQPRAVRAWLEAFRDGPVDRQVLLGDVRSLLADLFEARPPGGGAVEIAPFSAKPVPMVR